MVVADEYSCKRRKQKLHLIILKLSNYYQPAGIWFLKTHLPSCLSPHRVVSAFSASQDAAHDIDTLQRYKVSTDGSIERACPCLVVMACVVT